MESDWVYCHFRQKKDSLNNFNMKFGKIDNQEALDKVDFRLAEDTARSMAMLKSTAHAGFQPYVGCPLWGNKAWIGKIYPKGSKQADFLRHYAYSFNGIELNSTHYRVPTTDMVSKWREMASEGFLFSPKIPQLISHHYRLYNCSAQITEFCEAIAGFRDKLGCSFVQLPPNLGIDQISRLAWFLDHWPGDFPLAIEFRNESWFEAQQLKNQVLDLLEASKTTAVITDVAGRRDVAHMNLTTSTAMVRFVGNGLLPSDYERADVWVDRIKNWVEQGLHKLYFFVHEPDDTFAPDMASYFIEQLNQKVGTELTLPGIKPEAGSQMSLF